VGSKLPEIHFLGKKKGVPEFLIVITEKDCFLCNRPLKSDKTNEHIFPLWLIKKGKLLNKSLGLYNNTFIKYSKLKIPCCKKCNTVYLSNSSLTTPVQSLTKPVIFR
jgi:hypothetical protein